MISAVVDQENLDRQPVRQDRLQLLQVHHDGPVALQADRVPPSSADAGSDGCRQTVSHGGDGAVVRHPASLLNPVSLIAHHAAGSVGHRRQAVLRQPSGQIVNKGIDIRRLPVLLPLPGLHHGIPVPPSAAGFQPVLAREDLPIQFPVHRLQEVLRVRPHRHVHVQRGLFHFALIHVHHDHFRGPRPGLPVVSHLPDGNPRPDSQNQIRVLNRPVPRPVAHVSRPAAIQRMPVLDQVHRVPVGHNRDIQLLQHFPERRVSPAQPDAVSGVENRTLRLPDLPDDRPYSLLAHGRRQLRVVLRRIVSFQLLRLDVSALVVHRNVNPHRPRPSRGRQMPSPFQRVPDRLRILNHHRVLSHRLHGFHNVVFLVSHRPHSGPRRLQCVPGRRVVPHLSADDKHRNGIQPSPDHPGQRVRSAGAGGHAHRGNFVLQPCISLRRNGTSLFMMVVGHPQPLMMPQRVIQVHGASAHHAENIRHPVCRQKVSHIIRQSDLHFQFLRRF